jgi:hypothetical protein
LVAAIRLKEITWASKVDGSAQIKSRGVDLGALAELALTWLLDQEGFQNIFLPLYVIALVHSVDVAFPWRSSSANA